MADFEKPGDDDVVPKLVPTSPPPGSRSMRKISHQGKRF